MGGSGMQRSSSSSVRTVMALCLVTLVVVTVLYLAKRVEVNNTLRELELVKVESRDESEGLSNKIVEYVDKIEGLTRKATMIGEQFNSCQASKEDIHQKKLQLESDRGLCEANLNDAKEDLAESTALLEQTRKERNDAVNNYKAINAEAQDLQEENADLSHEYDECEAKLEQLHAKSTDNAGCSAKLMDLQTQLRNAIGQSSSLMAQVTALTEEKKKLGAEVARLKSSPAVDSDVFYNPVRKETGIGEGRDYGVDNDNMYNEQMQV